MTTCSECGEALPANDTDQECPTCNSTVIRVIADRCSVTGVYESTCDCAARTAFAAGDPFTRCPLCESRVLWTLLAAASVNG